LSVVFVGRLVPYKGADMLIEAAAPLLSAGKMTIEIVGDGPQMGELRRLVDRLGVGGAMSFAGWIDQDGVARRLAAADLFGFPSIREFGGAVVLEAMAQGAVPIIVNYGGPAELATRETGYFVELGSRGEIVGRLRETLVGLVEKPEEIEGKRVAGQQRAREMFTWEAKARQVMGVYAQVIASAKQNCLSRRVSGGVQT
jgi:glycosyltransferase involved in cell wall biosynthesis